MNEGSENAGENVIWRSHIGEGPLVATAIHDGHDLRPEVSDNMKLSERDRLREEDPYTGYWVSVAPTTIVALRSRFETDLNRPRDQAIYITPEDCWGLDVWKTTPEPHVVARSLEDYDAYYERLRQILTEKRDKFGNFVVLDVHSYNHRRGGPDADPEPADQNPEVNIGTGSLDRSRWGALIDRFIEDLRSFEFDGRRLNVRENIKFKGGEQVKWIHRNFADAGCGLAIEFKKFWMDEWTGEKDDQMMKSIYAALDSTIAGLLEELSKA